MNVIELAREAGIPTLLFPDGVEQLSAAHERFAALLRNAVMEECASEFEGQYTDSCPGINIASAIRALKGTPNVLE
jgi:hypothetical protein